MSVVEIRDYALWMKHIHGNPDLKDRLLNLKAGEMIELEIDGHRGRWVKMANGKDGRPTPGIKGIGEAQRRWHGMQNRRGELVSIREAGPVGAAPQGSVQPSPRDDAARLIDAIAGQPG